MAAIADSKVFLGGKWFRERDYQPCCSNTQCFNLLTVFTGLAEPLCVPCLETVPEEKKEEIAAPTKMQIIMRCKFPGCEKTSSFGVLGGYRRFCFAHKDEDMVNLKAKICEYSDCIRVASFGLRLNKKKKFCSFHKSHEMVYLGLNECEQPCCIRSAYFNFVDFKSGRFCAIHKQRGMVNVTCRRCEFEDCEKLPSYGYRVENHRRFCAAHKEEGMLNLRIPICQRLLCTT